MNTVAFLEKKFGPHEDNPQRLETLTREDLYKLFADLGFTVGVEVGLEKGKNAQTMFELIPNLNLTGVDPYRHYETTGNVYPHEVKLWNEKWLENCKSQCLKRMRGRNFTFLQGFSDQMVKKIEDHSVDFVYIDADHSYDMVMQDIILWGRKVKKDGILSGHDYFYDSNKKGRSAKVTQAVNDYTSAHGIKFYITGERSFDSKRKAFPSWFWVKLEDVWPNVIKP